MRLATIRFVLITIFIFLVQVAAFPQYKLYEKGHDSYKAGKYPEAIQYLTEYLTKALRDKSIDAEVFYIRALAYYKSGNFTNAIPDFEETLLRGHTNKGNIYWFMAKSYSTLGQSDESINSYNNAIRELSANRESKGKLLFERSQLHAKSGNVTSAYQDITAAYELLPGNADIKKQYESSRTSFQPSRQAASEKVVAVKSAPAKENTAPVEKPADIPQVVPQQETRQEPVVQRNPLEEMYKDEVRYALVIGNGAYPKEIGALRNPVNDANDMATELKNCNFEVQLLTNATYGQIRAALMRFKEKLDGGDKDKTVGLFYYAGHGVQFDDENFLVPVDAAVQYEDDIPRYCFPIQRMVLSNMENASTRMNIVILDACRNNPFPSMNRSVGGSGLGEMKRARGSFIAYATSPGSVAADGSGRNGLYTQELLKALKKPGLTIEQVFKEVRANVLKQSDSRQNTWDSSNILGEFHFRY